LDKVTFSSLDPVGHRITVADQTYAYDVLVGADGVLSAVRKTVTGTQQPTNLALEIQVPEQSDQMIIAFQSDLTGYYYQIPNVQGTIYGIGDVSGGSEKAKEKLKAFYGKGPLPKVRGAYLPTGNAVLLHAPHDIYFVGDAAGLIFPITGEGIYSALRSAQALSTSRSAKQYEFAMLRTRKTLFKHKVVFRFIYFIPFRNFMFRSYFWLPPLHKLVDKGLDEIL
jgi:flavin-dependent dehydrogenase